MIENYKKIEVPENTVPVYDIASVFSALQALGYDVYNIRVSETEPQSEEDPRLLSVMFNVIGLPVTEIPEDPQSDIKVFKAGASVNIFAAETTITDRYYVEDIVMSNFMVEGKIESYKSLAIDGLFHTLIKSVIVIASQTSSE